jgi:hypothetical protein
VERGGGGTVGGPRRFWPRRATAHRQQDLKTDGARKENLVHHSPGPRQLNF